MTRSTIKHRHWRKLSTVFPWMSIPALIFLSTVIIMSSFDSALIRDQVLKQGNTVYRTEDSDATPQYVRVRGGGEGGRLSDSSQSNQTDWKITRCTGDQWNTIGWSIYYLRSMHSLKASICLHFLHFSAFSELFQRIILSTTKIKSAPSLTNFFNKIVIKLQ